MVRFRYGENSGKVNIPFLDALFGGVKGKTPAYVQLSKPSPEKQKEPNFGVPAKTVVDSVDKPCSYYFDSGYRCVPYYQCQNGEVVVDGAGFPSIVFESYRVCHGFKLMKPDDYFRVEFKHV